MARSDRLVLHLERLDRLVRDFRRAWLSRREHHSDRQVPNHPNHPDHPAHRRKDPSSAFHHSDRNSYPGAELQFSHFRRVPWGDA